MTDKGKKPGDYLIGYGKLPAATKFKKGQSGNPSGRPRKRPTSSIQEELARELSRQVDVSIDGKKTRIARSQVIAKRLVNTAQIGNLAATKLIVEMTKSDPQSDMIAGISGAADELARKLTFMMKRRDRDIPRPSGQDGRTQPDVAKHDQPAAPSSPVGGAEGGETSSDAPDETGD